MRILYNELIFGLARSDCCLITGGARALRGIDVSYRENGQFSTPKSPKSPEM